MGNSRMIRHIENSFNDIGLEELRRSVYDYTSAYIDTTFPERDTTVFSRENQLAPFTSVISRMSFLTLGATPATLTSTSILP